ncbi:MAG: response regulator transcription factor [Chloroflexi bacterium]|nr:response regulator transcription factor [Chloroflexota bacterium]
MNPIKVMLADDHAVLRDSLRAFLAMYSDIEVVGEAADGLETLAQAQALRPHVLLLDMAMPNLGGLEVLRHLAKEQPACKVLVLTQHQAPQYVLPALQAGAKGYLLKKMGGSEVAQAVRAVARGESVLHPAIAPLVIQAAVQGQPRADRSQIAPTEREGQVLALIAEGKTNPEIALALGISQKTVDKHRANLMRKLGVTTRAGLIRYALDKE